MLSVASITTIHTTQAIHNYKKTIIGPTLASFLSPTSSVLQDLTRANCYCHTIYCRTTGTPHFKHRLHSYRYRQSHVHSHITIVRILSPNYRRLEHITTQFVCDWVGEGLQRRPNLRCRLYYSDAPLSTVNNFLHCTILFVLAMNLSCWYIDYKKNILDIKYFIW